MAYITQKIPLLNLPIRNSKCRTSSSKNDYHLDYKTLVEFARDNLDLNMNDISNLRVRMLWSEFEKVQSKKHHKKMNDDYRKNDCLAAFCDDIKNDAVECRVYDV